MLSRKGDRSNQVCEIHTSWEGVRVRGGDLTKEQKFWSISQGWSSIRSSNVVKNPHPGTKYQIKDKLCTYLGMNLTNFI